MRGFKYRIYPKENQILKLEEMFCAKRYVWNCFLELNMKRFEKKLGILTYTEMSKLLTQLKQEHRWLYQCEKSVLQNVLKDLSKAYTTFLKGPMTYSEKTIKHAKNKGLALTFYHLQNHPKFKSYKNPHHSIVMNLTNNNIEVIEKKAEYTSKGKFKKQNCRIKLPKVKNIKIAYSRRYDGRILNATLSKEADGKYYVSLCCTDILEKNVNSNNKAIGIDLGIKVFATTSDGETVPNPKYYSKHIKKLKKLQRELSRREKGSRNREKSRIKLSKHHKKIQNARNNFLHELTTELSRQNDIICIEDLKPKEMLKTNRLAMSISDASYTTFKLLLTYKMSSSKKRLIIVGKYYPSSQICSNCKVQNKQVKDLSIRTWVCPECGVKHNRDHNASKNILREGLKQIA